MDLIAPVRRWAVNWLAGGDPGAAATCLAEDYTLRIGAFTLTPREAYVEATVGQLERYPGLGVTVHDVVTDGHRTALLLSEHGASVRHGGACAAWRVVAVFEHDDAIISRGWAEEDYWARRRQLASGVADPVGSPAVAPWTVAAVAPEPGIEHAVRAWIEAGAADAPGVVRDDADLVDDYEQPASARAGSVDVLVVSGRRAGFHAVLDAVAADGSSVPLPVAGLVDVAADGTLTGHLVTDRLGLPPEFVVTVRRESSDGVLVVTIDRPERRNSVDLDTAMDFAAALDELDADDDIRVAIVTGAGGIFCAGMDLKAFAATGQRPEVPGRGFAGITRVAPRKPVIAAVEGYALGGGLEIVLACDLVVAARDATFAMPEARRGLVAGSGGLLRLPRRIPVNIAMELGLTGRHFTAEEAFGWGLVNRVSEPGAALDLAMSLAGEVLASAPLSVDATKQLITGPAAALPWTEAFAEQDRLLEHLAASDDAREGAAAFVEKRPPRWSGRVSDVSDPS